MGDGSLDMVLGAAEKWVGTSPIWPDWEGDLGTRFYVAQLTINVLGPRFFEHNARVLKGQALQNSWQGLRNKADAAVHAIFAQGFVQQAIH